MQKPKKGQGSHVGQSWETFNAFNVVDRQALNNGMSVKESPNLLNNINIFFCL